VLPLIDTAVELRAPDGDVIPAVVAFVTDTYAAVERPSAVAEGTVPDGSLFDLMWPGSNGVNILPVRVTERTGRGETRVWEAAAAGEPQLVQRRAFVRASMSAPMTLTDRSVDGAPAEDALLLDVSEAALRCTVYGDAWSRMANGSAAAVSFVVDDTPFISEGTVLRTRRTEGDPAVEVIVMFESGETFTTMLRAAVSAERRRLLADDALELVPAGAPSAVPEPAVPAPRQRKWWRLR